MGRRSETRLQQALAVAHGLVALLDQRSSIGGGTRIVRRLEVRDQLAQDGARGIEHGAMITATIWPRVRGRPRRDTAASEHRTPNVRELYSMDVTTRRRRSKC